MTGHATGAFDVQLTPPTGRLTDLAGAMTIQIADGKHSYEFEYALAPL